MQIDLAAIRRVFPDWPSELDFAKGKDSWALMAQNFHSAAIVLVEQISEALAQMHSSKDIAMSADVLRKTHLSQPAIFCISFALELAAKAATVTRIEGKGIEHDRRLPFAGHCLVELCKDLPELNLSEDEWALAAEAERIVVAGKYPSGLYPKDDKTFQALPDARMFVARADQIYNRLIALA